MREGGGENGLGAAWNRRTNQRAVENITQLVVEICHQMEDWRRLLRHLDRLEPARDPARRPLISRPARES